MRISQLAARSGVPATTLRYYEQAGLLRSRRTAAGYRVYGDEALERLAVIGVAKGWGLSLSDIGAVLSVWAGGPCAEVKSELLPRLSARLRLAEARLAELSQTVSVLREVRQRCEQLPDRQSRCDSVCGLSGEPAEPSDDPARAPIACSLSADDEAARTEQWRTVLDGATRTRRDSGFRLTLPADRAAALAELIVAEQRCCSFFGFTVRFSGATLVLDVDVPPEALELAEPLFGSTTL
ncbi:MerR family transcriptional regulator [Nocardia transvalensis]|nr:MerR family transcriptional regulator [Nocardia transvalensis]